MILNDLCEIKTNFKNADFWINKNPNYEHGVVTKVFNEEHIGIKVIRTDLLVPDYLYYVMIFFHKRGVLSDLTDSNNQICELTIKNLVLNS